MIYLTQPKEAILMIEISSDTIRLIDCCKKHKQIYDRTKNRRIKNKQLKKSPMLALQKKMIKTIRMDDLSHSFTMSSSCQMLYDKWFSEHSKEIE